MTACSRYGILKRDKMLETKITTEEVKWVREHRAWIESRNKIVIGIVGIALILITIYLYIQANIRMFSLTTSAFLIFFAELSLTFLAEGTGVFIVFQITNDKELALAVAVPLALAAVAVAVAALAVGVPLAVPLAVAAVAVAVAVAALAVVAVLSKMD